MHESEDKELIALLQRRSDLAAHYRRVPIEEPSPEIDAAIREAARQAIQRSPGRQRERWIMPAAAAAVLVLGVSVAVLVRDVQPPVQRERVAERGKIAYQDEIDRRASEVSSAVAQKPAAVSSNAPRDAAKSAARHLSTRVDELLSDRAKNLQDSKSRTEASERSELKEIAVPPPSAPSSAAESPALDVAAVNSPASEMAQAGAAKDMAKKSDLSLQESKAAPSASESPARQASQVGDSQLRVQQAPEAKAENNVALPSKETNTSVPRSAEEWLKEIATLRQQGRVAEAERMLEEFRRRYPTHPMATPKP
jgi:hypothetical protein